jgi:hypothetical protein
MQYKRQRKILANLLRNVILSGARNSSVRACATRIAALLRERVLRLTFGCKIPRDAAFTLR